MEDVRLSPPEVYAKIAELVRFLTGGEAKNVHLSYDIDNAPRTNIGIPMPRPIVKDPLKPRHLKMLSVLGKSPKAMTRKELRSAMTGGRSKDVQGSWGRAVSELVSRGLIFERDGVLSDTIEKLEIKE